MILRPKSSQFYSHPLNPLNRGIIKEHNRSDILKTMEYLPAGC